MRDVPAKAPFVAGVPGRGKAFERGGLDPLGFRAPGADNGHEIDCLHGCG